MIRFAVLLAAVTLAGLLSARATAQQFTTSGNGFQIIEATAANGKLTWPETQYIPVQKEIAVEVIRNGNKFLEKRSVFEYQPKTIIRSLELKTIKAMDTAGKDIDSDKLVELLKEKSLVILTVGPLTEKQRALFKDKTIFVDMMLPKLPGEVVEPVPPPAKLPAPPPKM